MPTDILPSDAGRLERLRHRAVLWEADLYDLQLTRAYRAARRDLRDLDPSELAGLPLLADALAQNDGFPPRVKTGSPADSLAARKQLEAMHAHGGPLVLVSSLRLDLPRYIKTPEAASAWKSGHSDLLAQMAPGAVAFYGVLQTGADTGNPHDHTVLPLCALRPELQALALSASAGAGGGAVCPVTGVHVVLLADTPTDRAKVASYFSRDSDGRHDLDRKHPARLQALEDDLTRKAAGLRSPRLVRSRLPASWRPTISISP